MNTESKQGTIIYFNVATLTGKVLVENDSKWNFYWTNFFHNGSVRYPEVGENVSVVFNTDGGLISVRAEE